MCINLFERSEEGDSKKKEREVLKRKKRVGKRKIKNRMQLSEMLYRGKKQRKKKTAKVKIYSYFL